MRTGMILLLWTTHVTEEHFPLLADLKKTGFDGVEIPLGDGDAAHYGAIRRELDRLGLACTTVTSLTADTNPVDPDASVRERAVERLRWAVEMSAILGSHRLVGPFHSAYKVFTGQGPTEDEKRRSAEVLHRAAQDAAAHDVTLCIEFLNRFECYLVNTAKDAAALAKAADHERVRVLYDTHHAHIEEPSAERAITENAHMFGHVHVSENHRGVPGSGQVAWQETFRALHAQGYDDWLVIESFSRLDPAFASAIHIWRDFFDAPERVYRDGLPFIQKTWSACTP
ncbi:MAG: sugar phosphate isomerase/epimerase [Planctomycetes bacterium]|nr:sugar phosphate isomerase/epimerase [Planctomycetota bacterium]